MIMTRLHVLSFGLVLLAIACAGPTAATPTPVAPTTPLPPTAGDFFLKVTSPPDASVVTTATISVAGETTADAVVTVNGVVVEVDANGRFQRTLTLEAGPNTIEVLASDFSGNQAHELRTVIFVR